MVSPSSKISKLTYLVLISLLVYYILMDIGLYLRVQNYSIERNLYFNLGRTANSIELSRTESLIEVDSPSVAYLSSNIGSKVISAKTAIALISKQSLPSYKDHTWLTCDINPLCHVTVKALLLDHTNHYIYAPLATIFDNVFGFSQSSVITPNIISFFHVLVACIAGKLISSDNLKFRRLGVLFFEFRTLLDDLDGHVARAKKHIRGERSEIGTSGYYVDGICDGLGCIALLVGIFFFLKKNPPRREYFQLPTKVPEPILFYKKKPIIRKIVKKIISFSGQMLLSSTAWNRYIAVYQDMLEQNNVTDTQLLQQNAIFKSNWFFAVAWFWRVINVHSLLQCVLLSIFCDNLWDFLKLVQYFGYLFLLVVICISEMHILEAQNIIYRSMTPL